MLMNNAGKSRCAYECCPGAFWLMPSRESASGTWWDGYEGQHTVIIDEFYSWLRYDYFLRLTDRYPLQVETKGGSVQFVSRRIVFTSNTQPAHWYPNIQDRAAFDRRISCVFHFPDQGAAAATFLAGVLPNVTQ